MGVISLENDIKVKASIDTGMAKGKAKGPGVALRLVRRRGARALRRAVRRRSAVTRASTY